MKVSISWLNEYVPVRMTPTDLAEALTMAGLEVEALWNRYEYLNTVVVGKIIRVIPHPNADKLRLCSVDIGERQISVVCGAPNAAEGMLSPVALPGTEFPTGFVLQKSVIRGQASEGMLCSAGELIIGNDRSGIMTLDPNLNIGEPLPKALNLSDMVMEIGLTPNRADCLSIVGIAREVSAIQKTPLKYPEIALPSSQGNIRDLTSVKIESPAHCPRYAARLVTNVKIAPSPFWLQERLISVGLKPINNIVDVTNFVMMELGQPLHAFDFDHLEENRIVVRTAKEGEKFTTLDKKERTLSSDMLMICDGKKPVAVAGVMGGLNSEIENTTTRVLIESACFNPTSIRKTAKRLGLGTDASHRFERGVDPDGAIRAIDRAAQLMIEVGGGTLISGVIDEYPGKSDIQPIRLSVKKTNRLLGTRLNAEKIGEVLTSVDFDAKIQDGDTISVLRPSFRVDVSRPEDLMEEVARLWGYDNIPTTSPRLPVEAKLPGCGIVLRENIRQMMTGFGFSEAINYSFIAQNSCDRLKLPAEDPRRSILEILNPISEDQAVMRTSLIPGLLDTMRHNLSQQLKTLKLFEVGKIFISSEKDKLPNEVEILAALWTGLRHDSCWHFQDDDCDIYDLKGIAEGLLKGLNIKDIRFMAMPDEQCNYTRPGHTAHIFAKDTPIGIMGEVHPDVLNAYDLRQKAFIFELNMETLPELISGVKQSKVIPRYPSVSRDATLIVSKTVEGARLLESVRMSEEKLMEDAYLVAVYEGQPIAEGKKSVSFRIVYRSDEKTLEDEIVNAVHQKIIGQLISSFNADLP
jgi:phenylalanyl-tRNA synthetase beta chain